MTKSVCIVQGHPHGEGSHFCHALAEAYEKGAIEAHAEVSRLDIAEIQPLPLSDPEGFRSAATGGIAEAQAAIQAADHLVVIFPLWLGGMPALLKAFFEQLARNDFLLSQDNADGWPKAMMKGRSARVIVTMGMPAIAYRLFFGAHGVRSLESGVLHLSGFSPVHETLIGRVEAMSDQQRQHWLERIERFGRRQV